MFLPLACAMIMDKTTIKSWRVEGPASATHMLEVAFFIKQQRTAELFAVLEAVSDPKSKTYGQHLTNEAIHGMVAPLSKDIDVVRNFAASYDVELECQTPNCDVLSGVASVATAENMLDCKYLALVAGERRIHRVESYSLPDDVAAVVDVVTPTTQVPRKKRKFLSAADQNTPTTLRELYGVDVVGQAPNNSMAVTAFLEQYYDESDLVQFWDTYCTNLTCGKGLPTLVGDATNGTAGVESMLDIETITGVAGNVSAEFWGFSGRSPDNVENEPFMKWLTTLDNTTDPPMVFSTSYGEDEDSWSYSAFSRLNVEFAKAGARGITLLYASGDEGANCESGVFVPEGPGSSPYVLAVGGTTPADGYPEPGSETAIGLSSGGFSNYWPMPSWQQDAVAAYLAQDPVDPSFGYNVSGRAYPDISAQASNFCVTPFGCGVAGTSCASPTAAGVFALLNDLRLQNGKSTLGFVNPLLYSNADLFNDITSGASTGCGFTGEGWPALTGWDAVTGLGTLSYPKLADLVLSLP